MGLGRMSAAPEIAEECHGCGAITELVQGSDYCWDCTYAEPLCLCAGRGWRRD
jgi:hypothetical protein